ncbi:lysozyme family protein [Virgibacillus kekensis]|uniref:Lysozyme family protein n=1 Tax=Virgibacillus kekensis TaxID=202261 RepID=A0ABV9DH80_9BACI
MKRKTKQSIKQTASVMLVLCGVFLLISFLTIEGKSSSVSRGPAVSKQVLEYRPLVEKYAAEYGVAAHVDVLMAMMMQESGGRGNDPMQSSESYCGQIGCIDNPELSIKQGVYYFSLTLEEANGDIKLAIQSYNFGKGFIDYVEKNSGTYSQQAAINFSQMMYKSAPNQSIYTCLREGAEQYNACYGDIYYVRDVLEYRDVFAKK